MLLKPLSYSWKSVTAGNMPVFPQTHNKGRLHHKVKTGQSLFWQKTSWSGLKKPTPGLKQTSSLYWMVSYLMTKNADIYETAEALESSCPEDRLQSTVRWHLSESSWHKHANEGCHSATKSHGKFLPENECGKFATSSLCLRHYHKYPGLCRGSEVHSGAHDTPCKHFNRYFILRNWQRVKHLHLRTPIQWKFKTRN